MSNSSKVEFLDPDDGLDYVFARMSAIFGAAFTRHWDGIEPSIIRQEWKRQLGNFLTYPPNLDYAIDRLNGDFVPSAIKFREFCNAGPAIPRGEKQIEYNPAHVDQEVVRKAKENLAKLRGKPWSQQT
jgi:hypothetical protein